VVLRGDEWYRFDPDTGLIAQLHYPAGVAIDPAGSVLVADGGDNRIRALSG
jgi:DNA-binding beta-propeller fold protein YncE